MAEAQLVLPGPPDRNIQDASVSGGENNPRSFTTKNKAVSSASLVQTHIAKLRRMPISLHELDLKRNVVTYRFEPFGAFGVEPLPVRLTWSGTLWCNNILSLASMSRSSGAGPPLLPQSRCSAYCFRADHGSIDAGMHKGGPSLITDIASRMETIRFEVQYCSGCQFERFIGETNRRKATLMLLIDSVQTLLTDSSIGRRAGSCRINAEVTGLRTPFSYLTSADMALIVQSSPRLGLILRRCCEAAG